MQGGVLWGYSYDSEFSHLKQDTPSIILAAVPVPSVAAMPGWAALFGNYPPGRTNVGLFAGWKFVK